MSDESLNALPRGYEFDGYRIEEVLGAGGFGITYRAVEIRTDRKVAIKEFLPQSIARRESADRQVRPVSGSAAADFAWGLDSFLREAKTLCTIDHPNVVRTHRYTEAHGTGYIVMEFVEGESLGSQLRRVGTLAEHDIRGMLFPLLDGLRAVHAAGFLHRDIKPDNIHMRATGQPVLLDFGAAREMERETHSVVLSHGYAPPEQYQSKAPRSPSADFYALGAMLYQCMTGEKPDRATDRITAVALGQPDPLAALSTAARQRYSPGLVAAVEAMLQIDALKRPQTISEVHALLASTAEPSEQLARDPAGTLVIQPAAAVRQAYARPAQRRGGGQPQVAPPDAGEAAAVRSGQTRTRLARPALWASAATGAVALIAVGVIVYESWERTGAALAPGHVFRDCAECPEMVVIPAGTFTMGSPAGEAGRNDDEGPQRLVTIARPFALGKYEVTFAQWDACVAAGGCQHRPSDNNWGRGRRPVIDVSWDDAKQYVAWLSQKTGKTYRLPSEAEWEYAARAGTTTPFSTGLTISTDQANYDGNFTYGNGQKGIDRRQTVPVGSFAANRFGLHDMHGNVWEWVEDCWHSNGAPGDGAAWTTGGDCGRRVLRGGSWFNDPRNLRAADRDWYTSTSRYNVNGFRVVRTLD